jgi:hypothetical protein
MAQLTYWSLAEYDHVPVVRSARKAMCKQMTAMFLNQWRLHAHICENFVRPATVPDRLKRFRFAASDTVLLSAEPTQERDRGGGQGVAGRLHGLQVLPLGRIDRHDIADRGGPLVTRVTGGPPCECKPATACVNNAYWRIVDQNRRRHQ